MEAKNNKFLGPGFLLFIDQLLVSIAGWVYWLLIFRLTSTSEVGQATTVYSLVLLFSMLSQLGLEYPLLKKSSNQDQHAQILGTALVIELVITVASVPIILYFLNDIFHESFHTFSWIAIAILFPLSIGFISRFALLGLSNAKVVLVVDLIGISVKFISGYTLISIGFGAFGLLLSFLLQTLLTTAFTFFAAKGVFGGLKVGNMQYFKEIIRDGLVNMPSKLKAMLMVSLNVVLLAAFGISSSEIGLFYAAYMLSIIVGSLSSSMSFMVIPASTISKADLSSDSLRVGLSLTAPLIAALIVAPKYVLSLIGPHYIPAETILLVLSIGILPASLVMNTISKLNNLNQPRRLLLIGLIQIIAFTATFVYFVPMYGTFGAAFSILISYTAGSILSMIWSDGRSIKYIISACVSIIGGVGISIIISLVSNIHPPLTIVVSSIVTMLLIITLKNTSINEIREIVAALIIIRKK